MQKPYGFGNGYLSCWSYLEPDWDLECFVNGIFRREDPPPVAVIVSTVGKVECLLKNNLDKLPFYEERKYAGKVIPSWSLNHGKVHYYPKFLFQNEIGVTLPKGEIDIRNIEIKWPFLKLESYKEQNEYRFFLENSSYDILSENELKKLEDNGPSYENCSTGKQIKGAYKKWGTEIAELSKEDDEIRFHVCPKSYISKCFIRFTENNDELAELTEILNECGIEWDYL